MEQVPNLVRWAGTDEMIAVNKPHTANYLGSNLGKAHELLAGSTSLERMWDLLDSNKAQRIF